MRRPAGGRGERADPASDVEAVATRRRRAAEEPLDLRARSLAPFLDVEVRNPIHRTSYHVLFPEFPRRDSALCTCTDFARRGLGTCKHLEAAWSWLQTAPALPSPDPDRTDEDEVWKRIDGSLESVVKNRPSRIRDVERAGEVLFEKRPATERSGDGPGETVGPSKAGRPPSRTTSRARP